MELSVPISIGELYDKITILQIKKNKISDNIKSKNIEVELLLLLDIMKKFTIDFEIHSRLLLINREIWDIEDNIRLKEKIQDFDKDFIELARLVYLKNDERSNIKREINLKYGSKIIEEKSY